jgi:hypothetical protein
MIVYGVTLVLVSCEDPQKFSFFFLFCVMDIFDWLIF